jgi:DNA-binding protein Fis
VRITQGVSAREWNTRYRIGQRVIVTCDDGSELHTATRSEAWNLGWGAPVVMVEGNSGVYSLARIRAIELNAPEERSDFAAVIDRIVADACPSAFPAAPGDATPVNLHELVIGWAEKPLIEAMLERNAGNQTWTAGELGINRNTLRKMMRKHGIVATAQHRGAARPLFGPRPDFSSRSPEVSA